MQLMVVSDGTKFKVVNPATGERVEGVRAVEYSIGDGRPAEMKLLIRGACLADIRTEPDDEGADEPASASAPVSDPDSL